MKALIIEDSRVAREGLMDMLRQFPILDIIGAAEDSKSALAIIAADKPDVLFLDIHMPGLSGFELLDQLDYQPHVIFTTAYAEHAIKSFQYTTIDYLLKPISRLRLAKAIEKLQKQKSLESTYDVKASLEPENKIFVKDGDKCHLITLSDIRYFESCKNYVNISFLTESALIKKSLNQIEERLPPHLFFRANRQFIVNLQTIRFIEEAIQEGYNITMDNSKSIDISRRQAIELKERLSL